MEFSELESGRLNPRDILGHLLLVWPVDYIEHAPTKFSRPDKPSDAIVVDVVDLDEVDDAGNDGVVYAGVWWRPSRLIQKLKTRVGVSDPVLATMQQGTSTQGMNAPFILVSATSDPVSVKRAEEWGARNPTFQATAPQMKPETEQKSQPQVEGETPREPTQLEKLARLAREGADRLPKPPEEKIPF